MIFSPRLQGTRELAMRPLAEEEVRLYAALSRLSESNAVLSLHISFFSTSGAPPPPPGGGCGFRHI